MLLMLADLRADGAFIAILRDAKLPVHLDWHRFMF